MKGFPPPSPKPKPPRAAGYLYNVNNQLGQGVLTAGLFHATMRKVSKADVNRLVMLASALGMKYLIGLLKVHQDEEFVRLN